MIILGLIQILLIFAIVIYEYNIKSISVFLWGTLGIMFGVMHFITTLFDEFEYSKSVLNEASIFVIGFCIVYITTRLIMQRNNIAIKFNVKNIDKDKFNERCINILFILLVICVFYRVYSIAKFSGGIFNSSWGSARELGLSRDYISSSQIITSLYTISTGIGLIYLLKKDKIKSIIVILLIVTCAIITRNRIEFIPIFCFVGIFIIFNNEKLTFAKLFKLFIFALIAIYIVYALRVFRHYGSISNFISEFNFSEFNSKIFKYIITGDGELGLRKDFYYFIQNNNNFNNFNKLHTYIRMAMVLVPTQFSFGLKPPDFAISMGSAVRPGSIGYSTHPTLFGDCYANIGVLGIFLGIFWAIFVYYGDKIIDKQNITNKSCLIVLYAYSYIIIGRGSVYNPFVWGVYGVIFLIIINILSKLRIRERIYD